MKNTTLNTIRDKILKEKKTSKVVSVRMTESLHNDIVSLSKICGVSCSSLINELLKNSVKEIKDD